MIWLMLSALCIQCAFSSNSTLGGDHVADEELARATGAGASASVHVADLSAEFTEESHNEQSTRDVAAHFGVDVEQAVGALTGEMPSGVMPGSNMPGGGMPSGDMPCGDMPGGGMPGGGMPESLVHADSRQDTCLSTDAHGATSHLDEEASALHQEARAQEAGAQEAIPRQGKNPRDIALMISCLVRVALSAVTEFALYTWGVARLIETGISTATAATLGAVFPLGMAIGRLSAGLVIRWRHIFTASIAVSIVGTFIVGVGRQPPPAHHGLGSRRHWYRAALPHRRRRCRGAAAALPEPRGCPLCPWRRHDCLPRARGFALGAELPVRRPIPVAAVPTDIRLVVAAEWPASPLAEAA